ncbi:MAG: A/G-specific adenine glycosylase [Steroidobacteraceae bacterium]
MTLSAQAARLAPALIAWHAHSGRHDLPWQQERTPYRVWVSEIMLQQTQVSTAIGYYQRFMQRFPVLADLAAAPVDEVLHLWTGLGYYSRARNLHRTAQLIVSEHGGEFPREFEAVVALPGIGRSTAAAILALSCDLRHAILDGNVRRVLARYFAVAGAPNERSVEQRLWELAEAATPQRDVAVYTQAIMDLGATVCTRANPTCLLCPSAADCAAHAQGRENELPEPRRRAARRAKSVVVLLAQNAGGELLLTRRPARGIWGGLWSPPEFTDAEALQQYAQQWLAAPHAPEPLAPLTHAFTHFDLTLQPLRVRCTGPAGVLEGEDTLWYNRARPQRVGLPAPIVKLIEQLPSEHTP